MFLPNDNRPRIKIRMTNFDRVAEFLAAVFMVALIVLPLIHYSDLPERIPVHFDGSGNVDGYGSKSTLLILPASGFLVYILLTILAPFPHIFNYPVKITPENAEVQYRLASRMMRSLKTLIIIMFTFICYQTVGIATGKTIGLGKLFLPVFLIATFGVVIFYFVQSLNNSNRI